MINANMMYLRPGNLFKEFVIENNRQKVTSTGRVVNDHKGDGIKTLYGCLADATTHTIVQRGTPLAKKTDKLVLGNRVFYIIPFLDIIQGGNSKTSCIIYCNNIKNTISQH